MIDVFSCSQAGGHRHNEDAFAVRPLGHEPDVYLCVVADGQGGRAGAARAAQLACQTCMDAATRCSLEALLLLGTWPGILRTVDEVVSADPESGYTTIVAFCLATNCLCGASCGDSAAVLLQADEPPRVLTARQHKDPPVGSMGAIFVPFAARLRHPSVVLAMSDGVWKYGGWEAIFNVAPGQRGEEIAHSIRDRARMPHSGYLQDDFTLLVLQQGST